MDLTKALPKLIAGRGIADADDTATIRHHRVNRRIVARRRQRHGTPDSLLAIGVTDPDIQQALDERQALNRPASARPGGACRECKNGYGK
jgi:hypothetical protein